MIRTLSTTLLLFLCTQLSYASKLFDEGLQALLDGNYAEAYCRWKPIAAQGDVDAQYNLAWLYANGNGMTVDVDKALYWWEKAAETGHADAEFAMVIHPCGVFHDIRSQTRTYPGSRGITASRPTSRPARPDIIHRGPLIAFSEIS